MRYVHALATLLGLAGAFWLGRVSITAAAGVQPPAASAQMPAQRELAELKRAIRGLHVEVQKQGERAVASPLTLTAPALEQCEPCPAAFEGDPEDADEAAETARSAANPRFAQGEAIVAEAVSRGRWTEEDIESFRTLQREDPGPHWIPLMQQIDLAITQGKLEPDPALTQWH